MVSLAPSSVLGEGLFWEYWAASRDWARQQQSAAVDVGQAPLSEEGRGGERRGGEGRGGEGRGGEGRGERGKGRGRGGERERRGREGRGGEGKGGEGRGASKVEGI